MSMMLSAVGLATSPVGAVASVDGTIQLPGTYRHMVVHPVTGTLFVAAGDQVSAYAGDGSLLGTVPGQSGAAGLALDGDDLYVARTGDDVVARISATDLGVTGSWDVGAPLSDSIATTGGLVWFASGDNDRKPIGALDPATGDIDLDRLPWDTLDPSGPLLRTSDQLPNRLFIGQRGISPVTMYLWDVTPGAEAQIASKRLDGGNLGDFHIAPDGSEISVATGAPYRFDTLAAETLEYTALSYEGDAYPQGNAYSADGRVHVGGLYAPYDPDLWVHRTGDAPALLRIELGFTVEDKGVAVAPDGAVVYAAEQGGSRIVVVDLAPVADSASPAPVALRPGATFTVHGSNLDATEAVTVDGASAAFEVAAGAVQVTVPDAVAAGQRTVRLTSIFGETEVVVSFVPIVQAKSATIAEGDSGSSVLPIEVTLSEPSPEQVTVDWRSSPFGAGLVHRSDFYEGSGTLVFEPGETEQVIPVTILGDTLDEGVFGDAEIGLIQLSSPDNAALHANGGISLFAVIDDDDPPTVVPRGGAIIEGDADTTTLLLDVELSEPSGRTVSVDWSTVVTLEQPAFGVDFVPGAGTVTFEPGQTVAQVPFEVIGDTVHEPGTLWGAEWGAVEFANARNVEFGTGLLARYALALIVDDDAPALP